MSDGWCIRHVDGRWRTMDSIGMPDWTEKSDEALCFRLRQHADTFAQDDPEDVQIVPATPLNAAAGDADSGVAGSAATVERPDGPYISGTGHLCYRDGGSTFVCECIKGTYAERVVALFKEALRSEIRPQTEDELYAQWNDLWLTANEEAQEEMFAQESLPVNHLETLAKVALRKTIVAFAKKATSP